ncbi:DUF5062 family protein [Planctobacterium marinum]|uniref:DUF5062 family protein n=1 Tax=Planctobacterium marinum TaxID=1631968 RepID=UPI001E47BE8F|nr:DUF5062 family protein [Planctobacterium marinum]MCC2607470.1 DUF5062 family protein [Planctobacterium marinum]
MKKVKNEKELLKKAVAVGETYAKKRGYNTFTNTTSADAKIEAIYRLLVNDKLIIPLSEDKENGVNMKHRLVMWIANQLPKDHPLLG